MIEEVDFEMLFNNDSVIANQYYDQLDKNGWIFCYICEEWKRLRKKRGIKHKSCNSEECKKRWKENLPDHRKAMKIHKFWEEYDKRCSLLPQVEI